MLLSRPFVDVQLRWTGLFRRSDINTRKVRFSPLKKNLKFNVVRVTEIIDSDADERIENILKSMVIDNTDEHSMASTSNVSRQPSHVVSVEKSAT